MYVTEVPPAVLTKTWYNGRSGLYQALWAATGSSSFFQALFYLPHFKDRHWQSDQRFVAIYYSAKTLVPRLSLHWLFSAIKECRLEKKITNWGFKFCRLHCLSVKHHFLNRLCTQTPVQRRTCWWCTGSPDRWALQQLLCHRLLFIWYFPLVLLILG